MTPTPVFLATVRESGTLVLTDRPRFDAYVRTLAGKDVEVVVRRRKSQRSLQQNKYWFAVPVPILAEHCGYTKTQMHYALLGECWGYTLGPTGQPIPVRPSSSELNTAEFAHMIDWCLTWAASELQVRIPEPNEVE